jgi:large subunit ribosomal protein L22
MEIKATLKYIRITTRKAMLVADLIRGKDINEAMNILKYCPRKRAAGHFSSLLKSAVANADQRGSIDLDNLFIKSLQVGKGPTLKRFRARAKGSATRINKKTSHLFVKLGER